MTLSLATAGEFTTFKSDQGIDLFFDYTAEVMSNVSGGDHTGTGYNGLASFGIEADLGQALGWPENARSLEKTEPETKAILPPSAKRKPPAP